MMRIADSLTLPDELEQARAAGELVVFAGAGVSMGPPANLPDFKGLARMIAEPRLPWNEAYGGSLDRYLGRAEREGVNVQERGRRFIDAGGSHTPLHEHLLGIFRTADHIRLITSNFDGHFTTAAEHVYPDRSIPHYIGPALPPGQDFTGIVHLHGALGYPHHRLVLTDKDFAAAYMADGWASRFLVRVFADRTVLFVGYSVGDPIMRYLLHAVPPTGRLYGLWHDGEISDPEHSIIRVPFSTSSGGDRFGELTEGMRRWRWYAGARPSDHDRELRRLIALGPPASPIDADYIRARLTTEAGRSVFWTVATDLPWFEWAAEEGLLNELTNERGIDGTTPPWGRWCLDNFCHGANPPLLRFLRGRPLALQPLFLGELLRYVCTCKPLPPSPVLRQLTALIASQPDSSLGSVRHIELLLDRLMNEQQHRGVFALLRAATRLHLKPIERFYRMLEEAEECEEPELRHLSVDVETLVDSAELERFLAKHGHDLVAIDPDPIISLGEQRLNEAYELLDLARGDGNTDLLSLGRTAIAPSNQDRGGDAEDVLITLIRIVLDQWAATEADRLRSFAERHEHNERGLFRRLALYAYARCNDCQPDEILTRATAEGWARDTWTRPELYLVLRAHYGGASEAARAAFVNVLRDDAWWGAQVGERAARIRFSLSRELLRDAPDSPATQELAAAEDAAHPDWAEGDRDGYLSRIEAGFDGEAPSPIHAKEMLQWSPVDVPKRLATALRQSNGPTEGYSILAAVQQAVSSDPQWGARLLLASLDGDPSPIAQQIAEAVLWAMRDANVTAADQVRTLNGIARVASASWTPQVTAALGLLLDKWSQRLEKPTDSELLDLLDATADLVYEHARTEPPAIEQRGWTERAVNHPAGRAARVWWRVAETRDWVNSKFVVSVDEVERERWVGVAHDDTAAGAFARPILGMATDRLSAGDSPWATTTIFPAFNPDSGQERAAQLWDGRLTQNRWSWTTVDALRPYFDTLFADSAAVIPARSRQLGDWVAMLVADPEKSGLTVDQVHRFVNGATDEARRAFAQELPRHLERLSPDQRRALWADLLRPYWRDRLTNMPLALAPIEVREMISWVIALPEVGNEALAELRRSPGQQLSHADSIIWRWKGDDHWVRGHPTLVAGVVEFLVERNSITPFLATHAVTVLERAFDAGAPREVVLAAAEGLVDLSCSAASALVERLRTAT